MVVHVERLWKEDLVVCLRMHCGKWIFGLDWLESWTEPSK